MVTPQRRVIPFNDIRIGQAYESDTGTNLLSGLVVGRSGEDDDASGQQVDQRYKAFSSQQEFEQSLNVNVSADVRYGLFSGGGRFGFAESEAINRSSSIVVASCVVRNALRAGFDITTTPEADVFVRAHDPEGFRATYGDLFCQALRTGGECYVVTRVTSSSTEHQQQIAASLHAELNTGFAAVSVRASLENAYKDTSSFTSIECRITRFGGQSVHQQRIQLTDTQTILDVVNTFPAAAHVNAVAYEAELLSYDALGLPFSAPGIESGLKRDVLADCLRLKQLCWSLLAEVELVLSPEAGLIFADLPPATVLEALDSDIRTYLNDLIEHARGVSTGGIDPPVLFARALPVVPEFKRREVSRFSQWWERVKAKDPTLLADELNLVNKIATMATPLLTVPLDDAPPEAVEAAANRIEALSLSNMFPAPETLELLPRMITAPLEALDARGMLRSLQGIQPFGTLKEIIVSSGSIRSIQPLETMTSLLRLDLADNQVDDLTSLRAATSLQELWLARNAFTSIDALSGLTGLQALDVRGNPVTSLQALTGKSALSLLQLVGSTQPGQPLLFSITDMRALASLNRLPTPMFRADKITGELCRAVSGNTTSFPFTATRIGNSLDFQVTTIDAALSGAIALIKVLGASRIHVANIGADVIAVPLRLLSGPNDVDGQVGILFNVDDGTNRPMSIPEVIAITDFNSDIMFFSSMSIDLMSPNKKADWLSSAATLA